MGGFEKAPRLFEEGNSLSPSGRTCPGFDGALYNSPRALGEQVVGKAVPPNAPTYRPHRERKRATLNVQLSSCARIADRWPRHAAILISRGQDVEAFATVGAG